MTNLQAHERPRAALPIMLVSGFCGLGYQMIWTQQCALWLGHEAAAVLAVITAFFGGLALGALLAGPRLERSARALNWYSGCELLIAGWSAVLVVAAAPIANVVLEIMGNDVSPLRQWCMAFAATFLLLLPATAAMGATLPAMERVTAQLPLAPRSIAALYASNTLGAMLGVLAIAFLLVPRFGLTRTALFCIALNLLCAGAAWRWLPRGASGPRRAAPSPWQELRDTTAIARGRLFQLFATGLLGIGYEVLVVRVLSEVTENTVYTFAMLLAVYLVGTAAGAALYARWITQRNISISSNTLFIAVAGACLLGTAGLWAAPQLHSSATKLFGASYVAALGAEAWLALLVFALPTMAMGALFSQLTARAHAAGPSFGLALAVNTLGAALAPPLFGVMALPVLGAKAALLGVAAAYLALARVFEPRARLAVLVPPSLLVAGLAFWAPPLGFVDVPTGGRLLRYDEGVMAAVSIVEDANGVATLRINNRQQEGSSETFYADARQAWLPLLLHPAPRRALFLGLGTGVTASAAAEDPTVQVEAVELLPEVIAASAHFTDDLWDGAPTPRPQLIAADARRHVRTARQSYDVIVADNFHPSRSGSGSLYTTEHFAAVRDRLSPQGLFCQWLPLHQLDLTTLRSIVQSFLTVYPDGRAVLASNSLETPVLGLIGWRDAAAPDLQALRQRLVTEPMQARWLSLGFEDEFAVFGSFIAGPKALRRFAAAAPANTDDHPVVAYLAPRITYAPDSRPRDRLLELLHELARWPAERLLPAGDDRPQQRLDAYAAARNRFLESGKDVQPTSDVRAMLAQVRDPLLEALRLSADFRPAYDPLLRMAAALANSDQSGARQLLLQLSQLQPQRPEARAALRELDATIAR